MMIKPVQYFIRSISGVKGLQAIIRQTNFEGLWLKTKVNKNIIVCRGNLIIGLPCFDRKISFLLAFSPLFFWVVIPFSLR